MLNIQAYINCLLVVSVRDIIALHWCLHCLMVTATQPRILFLAAPLPNCTLNASHSPGHTQSQNCCPHKHSVSAALIGSRPLYTGDCDQWQAALQAVALVDGWAACTGTGGGMRLRLRILRPGPPTLGPAGPATGHSLVSAALSTFLSLSSFTPTPHKCEKCEVKSNCSSQQQMKLRVVIYFCQYFSGK